MIKSKPRCTERWTFSAQAALEWSQFPCFYFTFSDFFRLPSIDAAVVLKPAGASYASTLSPDAVTGLRDPRSIKNCLEPAPSPIRRHEN